MPETDHLAEAKQMLYHNPNIAIGHALIALVELFKEEPVDG